MYIYSQHVYTSLVSNILQLTLYTIMHSILCTIYTIYSVHLYSAHTLRIHISYILYPMYTLYSIYMYIQLLTPFFPLSTRISTLPCRRLDLQKRYVVSKCLNRSVYVYIRTHYTMHMLYSSLLYI